MSKYWTLRSKKPPFSFLVSKKMLWVIVGLMIVNAAIFIIGTGVGSVKITPLEVIKVFLGIGSETNTVIVHTLRLPRMIVAVLVGSSLAVSGAILQGLIRNPLASPDIVGITGGASLGAVCFFFFLGGTISIQWLPLCAIIGAFLSTFLIYILAWKKGVSPLRMVMIGIGMSSAYSSISYMLMISGPIILANKSMTFMTGSIYGVSWEKDVLVLLPWVVVLLPVTLLLAREVNVQELGQDIAAGVGSAVQAKRAILILLSVGLAGAAVAIGGAIGFIGLMAPHIARKLVGPAFGGVLPVSALIGAFILLVADLAARTLFTPLDIPAGVFTAVIGAPFFVYLLYKHRHS
ncbi:putative siderophore transport system permease protein YfhA [Paenibacillus konkukensis]|uniref:Siderophore transport system permease protein YfhA n=1 Tax=Paenibacillus konkukensis TaxID=2020716 RepID=A0ABY4RHL9_9BACL|nr:iron chelate uptake ABC transporter family permease subunit [Paenibacillus konkukensis]UQZ81693.1 putative siderophore transport system permease protein YfhA [Paenibacillus konkukensis]